MLSSQLSKQRLEHRKCFLKLLSNAHFLSRQGLALRGDGDEANSNFMQLISLRSEDDSRLSQWVKQKTGKYNSPDIQNEMVKVMATHILRKIACDLQSSLFYTIMVDETADVANIEQVVVCLRWWSAKFEAHEEFIGLCQVESIEAERLYRVISDVLLRLNLSVSKVRGHCYDGASAMCGAKSGVAARVRAEEPRAVFTHCYSHSLNLASADTIWQSKLMRDALDTTHEITKLIKKSPRRNAILKRLKDELASDSPGIHVLCPTRWTVKAEALKSILDNFNVLLELWDESLEVFVRDTDMKARIQGVAAQMRKFNFFFGVSLGLLILRHSDNLSRTLQRGDMSAAEGQEVMHSTLTTLQSIQDDFSFDGRGCVQLMSLMLKSLLYLVVERLLDTLMMGQHLLFLAVMEYCRVLYFEALDLITYFLHLWSLWAARIQPRYRPSSSKLLSLVTIRKNYSLSFPSMAQTSTPYSCPLSLKSFRRVSRRSHSFWHLWLLWSLNQPITSATFRIHSFLQQSCASEVPDPPLARHQDNPKPPSILYPARATYLNWSNSHSYISYPSFAKSHYSFNFCATKLSPQFVTLLCIILPLKYTWTSYSHT